MKFRAIFWLILLFPALGQANIAIVTDILKVQVSALGTTSNRTANQLASNLDTQIVNLYEVTDGDLAYDPHNPNMLLDTVDYIYGHPVFDSLSGLTTSLNGVSSFADDYVFINDAYSATSGIVSSLKAFKKVTQQVSSIFKLGDTAEKLRLRSHILNNLLQYGSGNRNTYLQLKNNVNDYLILTNQVNQFSEFVQYLVALGDAGSNSYKAYKAIDALVAALKPQVASETLTNLKNGEWAKLVLQDFIIDRWRKEGKDFSGMNAYTRDGDACLGLFNISPCKVKTGVTVDDVYISDTNNYPESYYDFEVIVTPSVLAGQDNTFVIELPESIVNHPVLGQPVSVTYRVNGVDILQTYPTSVSSIISISSSSAVQAFSFDLNAIKEFATLEVSVQYNSGLPLLALDYLIFKPQLSELSFVELPVAPVTDGFSMKIRICGDPVNYVNLAYKNLEQTVWQQESFKLMGGIAEGTDCKKYTLNIDGWDIHRYTSSNRDIQFVLGAAGFISLTETVFLTNSSDVDYDGMKDYCEQQYFGDLSKLPDDDADNDGVSNGRECKLGSDPTIAGVAGITQVFNVKPLVMSNGSLLNECSLNENYWANVNIRCNTTLYEDVVIVGSVNLQNYTFDLNGYTLKVYGDLVHSGGTLNINAGRLVVEGDYRVQSWSGTNYSYSSGVLKMINSTDKVIVAGDFVMDSTQNHSANLTAGELEIAGDFTQLSTYSNSYTPYNFNATGTHRVKLVGNDLQTVSFSDTGVSHFNYMDHMNSSVAGVEWSSQIAIKFPSGLVGNNISLVSGTLDLHGETVTIQGDLIQRGGSIHINGGSLIIEGDYRIQTPSGTDYSYSSGALIMTNNADTVRVSGDFVMDSTKNHSANLTAGELEIAGDFTQLSTYVNSYTPYNFNATGTHKVSLSGISAQTLSFADPGSSHINVLQSNNDFSTEPVWASAIAVNEIQALAGTVVKSTVPLIKGMNYTLSQDNEFKADANGNVFLSGATLNLNGKDLTVKGNLIHTGGTLNVNGGRLVVEGDYRIQSWSGTNYSYSSGVLKMINSADKVIVAGDFVMDSTQNHSTYLTAGELEIAGDFTQLSTYVNSYTPYNFNATGTHRVKLVGNDLQTVSFSDPGVSHFNYMDHLNSSVAGVEWDSQIAIKLPSGLLGGNISLVSGTLDLHGETVTIQGDLIQRGGRVHINGGSLIIEGDYRIQTPSGTDYSYSSGALIMTNNADTVRVSGDFVMDSTKNHSANLTAGELEIAGDFTQLSTYVNSYTPYNFNATGTHRVKLVGGDLQTVYFADPGVSRFNVWELRNTSTAGVVTVAKTIVSTLFDHHRNVFTLFDNASANFVDYDGDGIKDHLDTYPTDPLNLVDSLDDDNDNIPDLVEIANGLNPLNKDDALLDKDGDGYSNIEEFLAGTDISDSNSMPLPETPVITPDLNTLHSHIAVRLEMPSNDLPIYYTLDGSAPTSASTLYSGAFLVDSNATVKAVAIHSSGLQGNIASRDYTVLNKAVWTPIPGLSWQWQLQNAFDFSVAARVYDIDLFDTPVETISTLKSSGSRVICYFNAGAWEDWRTDAANFPESVKGNMLSGYADEKWLDIRQVDSLADVMLARFDLAVAKGCDAVEPDNIDGYSNNTGFALTAQDQINYNLWLSNQANARGLSIGLKNDVEHVQELEPFFDWALNEQCLEYNECDTLLPFIASNKAVFGVAYVNNGQVYDAQNICSVTDAKEYSWIIKHFDLDSWLDSCADYRPAVDSDNDGVVDYEDNCLAVDNYSQHDSDNDNFGNQCDADFNNDGFVNANDLSIFKQHFFSADLNTDLNGDGFVNANDLAIFKGLFFKQPGPAAGQ